MEFRDIEYFAVIAKQGNVGRAPMIESIGNADLDLAVTYLPPVAADGLAQEYLCDDQFVVYCSVNHPLAKKKRVILADLAQAEWAAPAANTDAMKVLIEVIQA